MNWVIVWSDVAYGQEELLSLEGPFSSAEEAIEAARDSGWSDNWSVRALASPS